MTTGDEATDEQGWRIFDRDPAGYEAWYTTPRGRRVDRAEKALLTRLLAPFATARRVVEIGCGTGHFTRWLAERFPYVLGVDRAPGALAEARARGAHLHCVQGDAHGLPLRDGAVDIALFITTLEFLGRPAGALGEAVRVSRRGVLVLALNRWSAGGFSRRWGADARGRRLVHARDVDVVALRRLVGAAAGPGLRRLWWASALMPGCAEVVQSVLPLGDVIGVAVDLAP